MCSVCLSHPFTSISSPGHTAPILAFTSEPLCLSWFWEQAVWRGHTPGVQHSLQVLLPSPQEGCSKMHQQCSVCRRGAVITRMLMHFWLFFSLQTPLWKPDLQYPRGSFLWPLQPEDSVSNSFPSAQPPHPHPPAPCATHWPCIEACRMQLHPLHCFLTSPWHSPPRHVETHCRRLQMFSFGIKLPNSPGVTTPRCGVSGCCAPTQSGPGALQPSGLCLRTAKPRRCTSG